MNLFSSIFSFSPTLYKVKVKSTPTGERVKLSEKKLKMKGNKKEGCRKIGTSTYLKFLTTAWISVKCLY